MNDNYVPAPPESVCMNDNCVNVCIDEALLIAQVACGGGGFWFGRPQRNTQCIHHDSDLLSVVGVRAVRIRRIIARPLWCDQPTHLQILTH